MGWLFTAGLTKRELIAKLIAPWTNDGSKTSGRTRAHCVRGNVLWSVRALTIESGQEIDRWIECHLLGKEKAYGWGYKDMDESAGPCYYSCPVSYLDMVPKVACAGWRDKVRAYAAKRSKAGLKVGTRLKLRRCTLPYVTIVSLKPLRGEYNGVVYKVSGQYIDRTEDNIPTVLENVACSN